MATSTSRTVLSARILILRDDRALLLSRRGHAEHFLPGGQVERGRTVEEALRRGVAADTGYDIRVLDFVGCVESVTADAAGDPVHELSLVFAAPLPWGAQILSRNPELHLVAVAVGALGDVEITPAALAHVITGWVADGRPRWGGSLPATGAAWPAEDRPGSDAARRGAIRLDVRMLARAEGKLLLTHAPGQVWHTLPGGAVHPGESAHQALARHLGPLAGPPGTRWRFAGAIEHTGDDAATASPAGPEATGSLPGAPGAEHVLTLLFATDGPGGEAPPERWGDREVVAVADDDLVVTRLAPLPVAWAARQWLATDQASWRRLDPGAAWAAWSGSRPPVAALRDQLVARRDQLRGRRFREAAVAMCALITAADGRVDPAEVEGLRGFLATDPVMAQFPAAELERDFDVRLTALLADFAAGKRAVLAEIARVRGHDVEAEAVLRLGEVIARIDGAFPPVEQEVLAEAAGVLGRSPGARPPADASAR
jgi:tellurite resistance protein/ADP-ribose pyrophosphatase YjhB (NUDIX family)